MKKKETIIDRMLYILAEAHDLDDDIVDHESFEEAYDRANEVLDYEEESEPGEFDIFKFTRRFGDRYFGFYQKLKQILIDEGLTTVEQREAFIKKNIRVRIKS